MRIRNVEASDREAVRALIEELGYTFADDAKFTRVFAAVLFDKGRTMLVAEQDGALVGLACFARVPTLRLGGDVVTLDELVISERARGHGIGQQLLERVKAHAQEIGAVRIELHTSRKRESYQRGFYKQRGFTEPDSALFRIELGNRS